LAEKIFKPFTQVFDNYAVTVMIGDDPYTLGLFDTAGECCSASPGGSGSR